MQQTNRNQVSSDAWYGHSHSWTKENKGDQQMSTPNNDGGPAFPCESYILKNGKQVTEAAQGMALRDYFAGQALAGMFADYFRSLNHEPYVVAHDAYVFADAMLAARKEASK
jgi:hypothetical protein